MRIACVRLTALPLEAVFGAVFSLKKKAAAKRCAVRTEQRGRKILIDVSASAEAKRIRRGMTQTEARARLPELIVRDRDPAKEFQRLSVCAELLFAFGPNVEVAAPCHLFVEIGRSKSALKKKLKDSSDQTIAEAIVRTLENAGHRANVVVTKDPDTGWTFLEHLRRTRSKSPVLVVPCGQEKRMLAPLPVETLLWTDVRRDPEQKKRESLIEAQASLSLLGVRDIGRLQMMPATQIGSRFRDAGKILMARANAEGARPIETFTPPEKIREEFELERMTDELEPLLFILKRMYDRLEARLDARALSATSLELEFLVEPGLENTIRDQAPRPRSSKRRTHLTVKLARATRKASTMLKITREMLSKIGTVQAIAVDVCGPEIDHGAQLDLFSNYARRVEDAGELIGRLTAALGEGTVFSPVLEDTHRPERAWGRRPFDVEKALDERAPRVKRARMDTKVKHTVAPTPGRDRTLPKVDEKLTVTGYLPGLQPDTEVTPVVSWPKPVPRKPDDEPVPALPPRPLELLEVPEPASLLRKQGHQVLRWRGRRQVITSLSGAERLECEWWAPSPIARDYVVAEVEDGRRYWLFYGANGQVYVHGVFD